MNPLFIAAVFTTLIGSSILSIPFLRQGRIPVLRLINLLCGVSFVLFGWTIEHLTALWILGYAALWIAGYWIASFNDTERYLTGRAVLATLMSSIILYLVRKTLLLFSLQQGWLGYTATMMFTAGEIVFLLLLIVFTWNTIRALNIHLRPEPAPAFKESDFRPFVSIHLPICNEPVEVVTRTLTALSRLAYPACEVIVVDNNTDSKALWMPIKAYCDQFGFKFLHVNPHPGYKAGALNLALSLTSPAADLIAVVDADYELRPNFLEDTVATFQDPAVAYVQTAQRNRNQLANPITCMFNPVYDYFYDITMVARSQRNSSIFAGCAGLIRVSALKEVGGWAEWSITEDAELSLRLLKHGFKGVYINRGYGTGLLPENFEDIRKQWFRYFFGGLEIACHHLFSSILPRNKLSFMQRVDFVMGGMINLGAAMMVLSSAGIIITALAYSFFQIQHPALAGDLFHWLSVFSNWLIIFTCFQAFGMFLLLLVFRMTYHLKWPEAFRAAGSFLCLMTTQARAAFRVVSGKKLNFHKTPRPKEGHVGNPALRLVLFELLLCISLVLALFCLFWTAPSKPAVFGEAVLGLWQILIYGSAIWRAILST